MFILEKQSDKFRFYRNVFTLRHYGEYSVADEGVGTVWRRREMSELRLAERLL